MVHINAAKNLAYARLLRKRRRNQMAALKWMVSLCLFQHRSGRHFVIEQPHRSKMLRLSILQCLLARCAAVKQITLDQCAWGLADPESGLPCANEPRSGQRTRALLTLWRKDVLVGGNIRRCWALVDVVGSACVAHSSQRHIHSPCRRPWRVPIWM